MAKPKRSYRKRSLAEHKLHPETLMMTYGYQERLGITPAMLRISIGIEHPEDLIADLSRALEAV